MFGFSGRVKCEYPPARRGLWYTVEFNISLFPPKVIVTVIDPHYQSQHRISNTRFNFQSRDDYIDLLARDKWRSVWYDRYVGDLSLDFPMLDRMPAVLPARITASWDEPFVVVEFKLGGDFCQVCTRPRAGARGWTRLRAELLIPQVPVIHVPSNPTASTAGSSDQTMHDPSSSSTAVDVPERPTCLGFASQSNQPNDDEDIFESDEISEARLTEGEENIFGSDDISETRLTEDESDGNASNESSSDGVNLRNLSSVATLTTYAVSGDGEPDFPYEIADHPFVIDWERVEHTPT